MRRADPIVDLLLAADLPGIAARAAEREAKAKQPGGHREIAEAWKAARQACAELMPTEPTRWSTMQPALFPMSRVKSARERKRS